MSFIFYASKLPLYFSHVINHEDVQLDKNFSCIKHLTAIIERKKMICL